MMWHQLHAEDVISIALQQKHTKKDILWGKQKH